MSSVPAARIQRFPRRDNPANGRASAASGLELYPSLVQSLKATLARRRAFAGHRPSSELADLGRATGARI